MKQAVNATNLKLYCAPHSPEARQPSSRSSFAARQPNPRSPSAAPQPNPRSPSGAKFDYEEAPRRSA